MMQTCVRGACARDRKQSCDRKKPLDSAARVATIDLNNARRNNHKQCLELTRRGQRCDDCVGDALPDFPTVSADASATMVKYLSSPNRLASLGASTRSLHQQIAPCGGSSDNSSGRFPVRYDAHRGQDASICKSCGLPWASARTMALH